VASRPQATRQATPHDVADALALLALALRSGMGQPEALERVAHLSEGPVAAHLRAVTAALRWGRPSGEAWAYAPAAWSPAAMAWQVAERAGAGPAQLIEDASWRIREREDRRLETAGARAGVRLVLPLGLAFLPAFACTAVVPVVLALGQSVLGP
jgi:Flp pilus assembly protein TadB